MRIFNVHNTDCAHNDHYADSLRHHQLPVELPLELVNSELAQRGCHPPRRLQLRDVLLRQHRAIHMLHHAAGA